MFKINWTTVGLLVLSNLVMLYAWYGHLRSMSKAPVPLVILVSWLIALGEYCLMVPANRIGAKTRSLEQLKIVQEAVALLTFVHGITPRRRSASCRRCISFSEGRRTGAEMKAWVQRVLEASVRTDGETIAEIGQGYLVLLGVTHGDTEAKSDEMALKIANLRIFEDESGKANRSLLDTGGSAIGVSQFTLYADTSRGRRPGFSNAAAPSLALPLYERVVSELRKLLGADKVGTGRFGADMKVSLVNDGPFSIELLT